MSHILWACVFAAVLSIPGVLVAQQIPRSSTNYQIQFDSLNTAGARSSSTGYTIEDTVGEQATGRSDSDSYRIKAGYQQMDRVHLAISDGGPVQLLPGISLTTDNSVNGETWTVTTDNPAGYNLYIQADASPAMQHVSTADSFADYTENTPGTPDVWLVDSGEYEFGYSPYGVDVNDGTWGTNDDCGNTSTGDPVTTNRFYDGLTTSQALIANGGSAISGADTTICFAAGQNGVFAPSGNYQATVTVTAVSL